MHDACYVQECDYFESPYGCLWMTNLQYYINGAYFVCSVKTTSCNNRAFVEAIVDGAKWTGVHAHLVYTYYLKQYYYVHYPVCRKRGFDLNH